MLLCQYELHSDVLQLFDFMMQCWWWISKYHLLFWKWTLLEGLSTRLFIYFCKYLENPRTSLLLWFSEVNWACFGTYHNCFLSLYILLIRHGCYPFLKFCRRFLSEIVLNCTPTTIFYKHWCQFYTGNLYSMMSCRTCTLSEIRNILKTLLGEWFYLWQCSPKNTFVWICFLSLIYFSL